MTEKVDTGRAVFPHRLVAGLALVLLAVVWSFGWLTSQTGLYDGHENGILLRNLTALTLAAWNLIACVVAAGFFHAASVNNAKTYRGFRNISLIFIIVGVLFLFPIPFMTGVLGAELPGRALSLVIVGISFAGVAFGRARILAIQKKLKGMAEPQSETEDQGDASLKPLPN